MMVELHPARLATLALSGGLLALSLGAQRTLSQDELISRREAKFAEAFIKNAAWITDYEQALGMAKQTGKPIFAYFSRSFAP